MRHNTPANSPVFPSLRKIGIYEGSGNTSAIGLLQSTTQFVGTGGTQATVYKPTSGTGGSYYRMTSAATSGSGCGYYTNDFPFYTMFNPRIKIKFRVNTTVTSTRYYCGFSTASSGPENYVDGLNPSVDHGILLGFSETDTNMFVKNNNASATVNKVDTGAAKDTSFHIIEFKCTSSNFTWQLDGGSVNTISTQVPSSTVGMRAYMMDFATETTATREGNLVYVEVEQGL